MSSNSTATLSTSMEQVQSTSTSSVSATLFTSSSTTITTSDASSSSTTVSTESSLSTFHTPVTTTPETTTTTVPPQEQESDLTIQDAPPETTVNGLSGVLPLASDTVRVTHSTSRTSKTSALVTSTSSVKHSTTVQVETIGGQTTVLVKPSATVSTSANGTAADSGNQNVRVIAGSVIGGLVGLMILAFLSFWLIKRRRRARAVEDKSDDDAERRMLESAPEADKAGKRYHYNSFRPSFQAGLYKAQPPTQPPAETPPPPPPKPEETQTMTDAEYTSKYQWSLRRASQISRKSFADLEHGYSNLSGRQRPSLEEAQLADVSVDISRRSSMTFATPPSKRSSLVGVAWGAQAHSHLASGDSTAPGSIHSDTTRQSGAESVDVVYAPKTTGLPASE